MEESTLPAWVSSRGAVDEVLFCREFLRTHFMVCVDGEFFTEEGKITDESSLRADIYTELSKYVYQGIPRKIDSIVRTLRMECRQDSLPMSPRVLHVANGTYDLIDGLIEDKCICRHRLPVAFNADAPEPKRWLAFLDELLEQEDILTLQEYMGYCLIPTTRAQKMLIITGKGGEGKSRIGVVMKALLGDNMSVGSIAKIEHSPFARADLQHLLVLLDDDIKMEALSSTNYIKAIITAEMKMDLERKGIQSYQGHVYSRFMAFGNGSLKSLYDRSNGFFRRQIILTTKPRPEDRVDDPYLSERLIKEKEGIFLWCIEGLCRLIVNDYHFTISDKAKQNLTNAITDSNNILLFMKSQGYFAFSPDCSATSKALYNVYLEWCRDNSMIPLSAKSFSAYLIEEAPAYHIRYSTNVPIGGGKYARGFNGIRIIRM